MWLNSSTIGALVQESFTQVMIPGSKSSSFFPKLNAKTVTTNERIAIYSNSILARSKMINFYLRYPITTFLCLLALPLFTKFFKSKLFSQQNFRRHFLPFFSAIGILNSISNIPDRNIIKNRNLSRDKNTIDPIVSLWLLKTCITFWML